MLPFHERFNTSNKTIYGWSNDTGKKLQSPWNRSEYKCSFSRWLLLGTNSKYQSENHATGFTLLKFSFLYFIVVFFFKLRFCVGVTAITKTNYNQNCMPIASLEFPIPPSDMYPSAHIHINTHITHTQAHNHNGARTNTCICVKISLNNNDKHVPINYTPSKPYLLHLIQQACQLLFRFAILLILIGSLTWFFTIQHWKVVWNCWS